MDIIPPGLKYSEKPGHTGDNAESSNGYSFLYFFAEIPVLRKYMKVCLKGPTGIPGFTGQKNPRIIQGLHIIQLWKKRCRYPLAIAVSTSPDLLMALMAPWL